MQQKITMILYLYVHRPVCRRGTKSKEHKQKEIKCEIIQCNNARRLHVPSPTSSHTGKLSANWLPWNGHTGSVVTAFSISAFRFVRRRRRSWVIYCIIFFDHTFLHINFLLFVCFLAERAIRMPWQRIRMRKCKKYIFRMPVCVHCACVYAALLHVM